MTSFCDYGHCVHNTFVSLTEGRSARDLPKQLPAENSFCVSLQRELLETGWVSVKFRVKKPDHLSDIV